MRPFEQTAEWWSETVPDGRTHAECCPWELAEVLRDVSANGYSRRRSRAKELYGGVIAIVFGDRRMDTLRPRDWAVVMMCDKLARLAETLDHEDSVQDIGGYAETWMMCRERDGAHE